MTPEEEQVTGSSEAMMTNSEYDYGMPVHPVCDLFPLMDGVVLGYLEADIEEKGLLSPIVVHDGQLVDGHNRMLACRQAGIKPSFIEWRTLYQGTQSLPGWIWSTNAERRNLTLDQYVAVQVALQSWKDRDAAARQKMIEAGKQGGRGHKKNPATNSSHPFRTQPCS
jgi:hypothetical protein